MTRRVVGCMTGTSLDGLDVALVDISGQGLNMQATWQRSHAVPLGEIGPRLRALAEQQPQAAASIAQLMRDFSLFHGEAIRTLLAGEICDLVAVHGQTVYHAPPASWQLFQPAPLTQMLGVSVVCDLRAADLALGGQGAPITPLADWILLRSAQESRVVVNLGGFCNITLLPQGAGPELISGRDVCACNQLLDAIARHALGCDYDADGRAALSGQALPHVTAHFSALLRQQMASGRSLGTGDELQREVVSAAQTITGADLARSACQAIAETVVAAGGSGRYVLAGGGTANAALVAAFSAVCPAGACRSDDLGLPASAREAVAMAVLGALCQDRCPITLPQVTRLTGPAPIAGLWTLP